MRKKQEPSGIDSVGPPPKGATPVEAAQHYLAGYEGQFKRARRTVKRRSSVVTVATAVLTGMLAILGCVAALLATDWLGAAIAVTTTAVSATVSVLLAWNDHFHHRELWVQRSAVLAEINGLRRRFDLRSRLPWYLRRSPNVEVGIVMRQLDGILERDLASWTQIQSGKVIM